MKILVLTERLARVGGTEIYVARQRAALAELGHTVTTISAEDAPSLFSASLRPRALARGVWSARRLVDGGLREGYDAVVTHQLDQPAVLFGLAGRVPVLRFVHTAWATCPAGTRWLPRSNVACAAPPGLRCLATDRREGCLGLADGSRGWKDSLRRVGDIALQRRFLTAADLVVANSGYMAERIAALTDGAAEIAVVSPPLAEAAALRIAGARAQHALGAEGSEVLFVGRLAPFKGADHAIRAVARVPGVHLSIAGDGPDREALEALVCSLGLGGRVSFAGWLGDDALAEARARATVAIFPSLWPEPFGMAGLEAVASGCPVIAYDLGGVRDWLSPATGVLVPPGDEDALAGALRDLLADAPARARLAEAGRRTRAHFSAENFTRATAAALDRARENFRRRAPQESET